ncbi:MAG: rod shape-determining protein RodA [Bacteroidales bacterium]|nr:rod shape-determining protein RodA [Bacteroidales bacterium]MBP5614408.1 rod shape-determining protein RodA [Bacteroidales bacterium]
MTGKKHYWDGLLVVLFLVFVGFGWLNIFSTTFNDTFSFSENYGRQLIWIGISGIAALFLMLLNSQFFRNITTPLYIITLLLILLAAFVGKKTNGASSWLMVGGFGIQPAEFGKYATCLMLARFFSDTKANLSNGSRLLPAIAIIGLPIIFIMLQNDMGSAIPFIFLVLVLYREGLTGWVLTIGISLVVLLVLSILVPQWIILLLLTLLFLFIYLRKRKHRKYRAIIIAAYCAAMLYTISVNVLYEHALKDYQKARIEVTLGLNQDTKGIGYNVNQSKIAIGSGGLFGQGFMKGTQTTMNFVPEQSTDFIFCTIGEEWGFIGSAILLLLYAWLIYRIINRSEMQRDPFIRIYGYCISCIFFSHLMINIGMTLGLLPVIGIPLPFISYGGSSLIAYTCMLFTFISLDSKANSW